MKERYTPMEPLKVGTDVTIIVGKTVFEAVKPHLKRKMEQNIMQFYALLDRNGR
jgi:hypothetical protein